MFSLFHLSASVIMVHEFTPYSDIFHGWSVEVYLQSSSMYPFRRTLVTVEIDKQFVHHNMEIFARWVVFRGAAIGII